MYILMLHVGKNSYTMVHVLGVLGRVSPPVGVGCYSTFVQFPVECNAIPLGITVSYWNCTAATVLE